MIHFCNVGCELCRRILLSQLASMNVYGVPACLPEGMHCGITYRNLYRSSHCDSISLDHTLVLFTKTLHYETCTKRLTKKWPRHTTNEKPESLGPYVQHTEEEQKVSRYLKLQELIDKEHNALSLLLTSNGQTDEKVMPKGSYIRWLTWLMNR